MSENTKKKTTTIDGYKTGDHERCCIAEEDGIYRGSETSDSVVYFDDILPEFSNKGKHRFEITVEATAIEGESLESCISSDVFDRRERTRKYIHDEYNVDSFIAAVAAEDLREDGVLVNADTFDDVITEIESKMEEYRPAEPNDE